MALDTVYLIIDVVGAVTKMFEDNNQLSEMRGEFLSTLDIISSTVQGVKTDEESNYTPALKAVLHYLDEAKNILEELTRRRKGWKKLYAYVTVGTDIAALETIQKKLFQMIGVLGTAFGAQQQRLQDAKDDKLDIEGADDDEEGELSNTFDTSQILIHASAKRFWKKHVGSNKFDVSWERFVDALRFEYSFFSKHSLLSQSSMDLLQEYLDENHDGQISVYEFANFTDTLGVLKSIQLLIDPRAVKKIGIYPPSNTSDRQELLSRSVTIRGTTYLKITRERKMKRLIERYGPLLKWWGVEFDEKGQKQKAPTTMEFSLLTSGVTLEFFGTEVAEQFREGFSSSSLDDRKVFGEHFAVFVPEKTVDELIDDSIEFLEAKLGRKTRTKTQDNLESALDIMALKEDIEQENCVNDGELESKLIQIQRKHDIELAELRENDLSPEAFEKENKKLDKKFQDLRNYEEQKWKNKQAKITKKTQEAAEASSKKGFAKLWGNFALTKRDAIGENAVTEEMEKEFRMQFDAESSTKLLAKVCCYYSYNRWRKPVPGVMYVSDVAAHFHGSDLVMGETTQIIPFTTALREIEMKRHLNRNSALSFKLSTHQVLFVNIGITIRDEVVNIIATQWEDSLRGASKDKNKKLIERKGNIFHCACGQSILQTGWLLKEGGIRRNWKKRWIVLSDSEVFYSPDHRRVQVLRSIPLKSIVKSYLKLPSPIATGFFAGKHSFEVQTSSRLFKFIADTEREAKLWVKNIHKAACDWHTANRFRFFFEAHLFVRSFANPSRYVLEIDLKSKHIRFHGTPALVARFDQVDAVRIHDFRPTVLHLQLKNHRAVNLDVHLPSELQRDILCYVFGALSVHHFQTATVAAISRLQRLDSRNVVEHLQEFFGEQLGVSEDGKIDARRLAEYLAQGSLHHDPEQRQKQLLQYLREVSWRPIWKTWVKVGGDGRMISATRKLVLSKKGPYKGLLFYKKELDEQPELILNLENGTIVHGNNGNDSEFFYFSMLSKMVYVKFESNKVFRECMRIIEETLMNLILDGGERGSEKTSTTAPNSRRETVSKLSSRRETTSKPHGKTHLVPGTKKAKNKYIGPPQLVSQLGVERDRAANFEKLYEDAVSQLDTQTNALKIMESELKEAKEKIASLEESKKQLQIHISDKNERSKAEIAEFGLLALKHGGLFLKHTTHRKPKPRFVYLSVDGLSVCWHESPNRSLKPKSFLVSDLCKIVTGHETAAFKSKFATPDNRHRCFSFITKDRTLDLEAYCDESAKLWLEALRTVLLSKQDEKPYDHDRLAAYSIFTAAADSDSNIILGEVKQSHVQNLQAQEVRATLHSPANSISVPTRISKGKSSFSNFTKPKIG